MYTISKKSTKKAWARAFAEPGKEFPLTQLPIISGKIPDGLRGTLYRNSPARLERGDKRVGHWFDGDGAILAVNFTESPVSISKPKLLCKQTSNKISILQNHNLLKMPKTLSKVG
nr:carotenoid oxygenase family protein [Fortiea contorta]